MAERIAQAQTLIFMAMVGLAIITFIPEKRERKMAVGSQMIAPNAEPIENRNPLKRIDLTPIWPEQEPPEPISICEAINQTVLAGMRKDAANKIWKLVVQAAEAGGPVTTPAHAESAPVVPEVDMVYPAQGFYGDVVLEDTAPSEYCAPVEDVG